MKALENRATKTYLIYYISHLLINAFLVSCYVVLVYVDHPKCLYFKSGANITDEFDFAFTIGGIVVLADFMNTNCMCILFRYKVKTEENKNKGEAS